MTYYIQISEGQARGVWLVEDTGAQRIDVTNVYMPPREGLKMAQVLKSNFQGSEFYPLKLAPGQYFRRMARPNSAYPYQSPGTCPDNHLQRELIETCRGQLTALRSQLENIFRVVHPVDRNFQTYGHEIRNVLVLAAMECESHCKGVLSANGVKAKDTHDYVRLADAMRLREYAVRLPFYPWLGSFEPFAAWSSDKPTKSLPWYDAYNQVKHDRETQFSQAALIHAIEAVVASAVMIFAQFGTYGFHYREEINSFFELVRKPSWEPSEIYCLPYREDGHLAVPYPF